MTHTIHTGDSAELLKQYPDCHFDSIITDPPYGIAFLGKEWDRNTGAIEIWRECLRVLKPGGFLLAFSAARTYHHLATNIESVGFEIRDQLMWIYASGFPKAQDIGKAIDRRLTKQKTDIRAEYNGGKHGPKNVDLGMQGVRCSVCKRDSNARYNCKEQECGMIYKAQSPEAQQWAGWKTALKPAHEPIVMARKPFKGSTIDNVLQHGVGALNIDATRIAFEGKDTRCGGADGWSRTEYGEREPAKYKDQRPKAQMGMNYGSTIGGADPLGRRANDAYDFVYNPDDKGRYPSNVLGEIPDYQKYFYCPKVSRRERHCGFEQVPDRVCGPGGKDWVQAQDHQRSNQAADPLSHIEKLSNYAQGDVKNHPLWDPSIGTNLQRLKHKIMEHDKTLGQAHEVQGAVGNNHPTVKPVALMRYLIQLVTPANSTVLDPFCGSGSTGMAACELGHRFVGSDLDPHYVAIATRRIEGWISTQGKPTHIPAPFGSVKGCYDQGDGFAARHQQLQQDRDTANTATDKTQPFDRWFE
jgi:DNA modification methylase